MIDTPIDRGTGTGNLSASQGETAPRNGLVPVEIKSLQDFDNLPAPIGDYIEDHYYGKGLMTFPGAPGCRGKLLGLARIHFKINTDSKGRPIIDPTTGQPTSGFSTFHVEDHRDHLDNMHRILGRVMLHNAVADQSGEFVYTFKDAMCTDAAGDLLILDEDLREAKLISSMPEMQGLTGSKIATKMMEMQEKKMKELALAGKKPVKETMIIINSAFDYNKIVRGLGYDPEKDLLRVKNSTRADAFTVNGDYKGKLFFVPKDSGQSTLLEIINKIVDRDNRERLGLKAIPEERLYTSIHDISYSLEEID